MLLSGDPQNHNEIRLRWLDPAFSCSREELVTVLDVDGTRAILCSRTSFDYATEVSVVIGADSETAIVIACRPDQEKFIVIIQMVPSLDYPPHSDRDPGFLAVDDFLTEEQEKLLLEEIGQEWDCSSKHSRATAH